MRRERIDVLSRQSLEFDGRMDKGIDSPAGQEFFEVLRSDIGAWLEKCLQLGKMLPPATPERRRVQGLVDHWVSRLIRAGLDAPEHDRLADFDSTAGEALDDSLFPYSDLQAVRESHKLLGRAEEVHAYVKHVEEHGRLLIYSPSGEGKSSVALAGVIPKLRENNPDWRVVPWFAPSVRPVQVLRQRLAVTLGPDALKVDDSALVELAKGGSPLLIYVDQLEELLTLCNDPEERRRFSELLRALVEQGRVHLLATLRRDHYDRLEGDEQCRSLWRLFAVNKSAKELERMSVAQLRTVIQVPADRIGLRFHPTGIVDRLAQETAATPSGLPLLQFALRRLWDERKTNADGRRIDLIDESTYTKLPNLETALGTVAEAFLEEVAGKGLDEACRRLLLELTVIDERLEVPLRRRRQVTELRDVIVFAKLADVGQFRYLIDELRRRRLVVVSGADESEQIEVAHEALFRHWPTFSKWFREEEVRTTLRETRRIERDAQQWRNQPPDRRDDYLLLKGEPLESAREYVDGRWLDGESRDYVRACEEQAQRETAAAMLAHEALKREAALAKVAAEEAERAAQAARREAAAARLAEEALKREAESSKIAAEEAERATEAARREVEANQRENEALQLAADAAKRGTEIERSRTLRTRAFLFLLATMVIVAVWQWKQVQANAANERARAASERAITENATLLVWDMDPMQALDVAHTVKHLSSVPLEHALSRLTESELLFTRDAGPAQFSASGAAVYQLLRRPGDEMPSGACILPLDTQRAAWERQQEKRDGLCARPRYDAVEIDLPAADKLRLATIDVSPPQGSDAQRLVVSTWVRSSEKSEERDQFDSVRVHRIRRGGLVDGKTQRVELPRGTQALSDISFDADGSGFAMVRSEATDAGPSRAALWRWSETKGASSPDADNAQSPATAHATAPGLVIHGHQDGSITCSAGDVKHLIDGANLGPVSRVRVAPGQRAFVAQHESGDLTVATCDKQHKPHRIKSPSEEGAPADYLQLLRQPLTGYPDAHGYLLTYTINSRPRCEAILLLPAVPPASRAPTARRQAGQVGRPDPDAQLASYCNVPAGRVAGFLPIVRGDGGMGGYISLPDSRVPLLARFSAKRHAAMQTMPQESTWTQLGLPPAVSPDKRFRVKVVADRGSFQIEVEAEGAKRSILRPINPMRVFVNDQGLVSFLESGTRGGERLIVEAVAGGKPFDEAVNLEDVRCAKASAAGTHLVLVGRNNAFSVRALGVGPNGPVARTVAERPPAQGEEGASATACAVGGPNGERVAIGTAQGTVLLFERGERGAFSQAPLTERVRYRLPAAVRDIAMDGHGRFIAVVSGHVESGCQGSSGHLLQVYDHDPKVANAEVPLVSMCLASSRQSVMALGSLVASELGSYVLTVLRQAGNDSFAQHVPCLACRDDGNASAAVVQALVERAGEFQPKELSALELDSWFGIKDAKSTAPR